MNGLIRTVLGDVDPASAGRVDYHEHLFQALPTLPGEELDDEALSGREARLLAEAGIETMVDATPIGLGRRPAATARISAGTGLAVVMTTGCHADRQYADRPEMTSATTAELTAMFRRDLLEGLPADDTPEAPGALPALGPGGKPVMAGLIKGAIGYWSISPFERRALEAAGEAHAATGAPVMVHLEHGSAAFEVLELLRDAGVASHRVVLAHVDRNPDPGLHAEIAAAGAYLGYDGMARHREWPDSTLIETIMRVAALGGADRILLGGDVARRSRFIAYGGIPGMAYLPARFVPRLRRETGDELVDRLLVTNPARLLAWSID